jgi:putative ABC transport system ATP-binding protein
VGDQPVCALQPTDLEIRAGESVAVMGPSGSGKSTLLNIIGLLDSPTAGRYRFAGRETTGLAPEAQARLRRERIGFVFQAFHLIPRLSARENVELPLALAGVSRRIRSRRAAQLLEALGLRDRAEHRPEALSGGQRQRVAIARAMIADPVLLLADEPTGNLDRAAGAEVLELLLELNRRGQTLIVVTHDSEVAAALRRHIRLVDGRITSDQASS